MLSILGFLVILGPLVIFHELGHYFFAKLFNVKPEIFSVGFGPRIWGRQIGETEWRVSAIPLGGYVKLLGEEADRELSPEELSRALSRQAPWKRFFIFLGGPLFNFILAIFVFMVILVVGEPQMASVAGRVVARSAAEKAGFVSGDKILSIDGKPVRKFDDVAQIISDNPENALDFEVVHPDSATAHIKATPAPQQGFSVYGEATHVGEIDGLLPMARATVVGVSDPASPAGKAGFKTGAKITAINGTAVSTFEDVDKLYAQIKEGSSVQLKMEMPDKSTKDFAFTKPGHSQGLGLDSGLFSSELFIDKTVEKSPAEAAGLKAGDRLIGIDDHAVVSFFELKDAVQNSGERLGKVTVNWEREGKRMTATLTPTATQGRDPALKKTVQYTIGVVPQLVWAEPVTFIERIWNPLRLVTEATRRMAVFSWRNLVSIRKMVTGDVSIATLGGPILIGKIAGESLSRGLIAFLTTMAILSVGLGVLNILPIPVLDGGHLMLLAIESVRRKPLSIRQMEIIQQVGLSLILLLMVIVIRNDLARLPFFE